MKIQFSPNEQEAIKKIERDGIEHTHLPRGVVEAEIEDWKEFQEELEEKEN